MMMCLVLVYVVLMYAYIYVVMYVTDQICVA